MSWLGVLANNLEELLRGLMGKTEVSVELVGRGSRGSDYLRIMWRGMWFFVIRVVCMRVVVLVTRIGG